MYTVALETMHDQHLRDESIYIGSTSTFVEDLSCTIKPETFVEDLSCTIKPD
jgi:hypothetical protein